MTSPTEPLIVLLLEQFQATRLTKNWAAMGTLLHRDAKLESLAAPGAVLSGGELVEVIRAASLRGLYTVRNWHVEPAGPQAGLAVARIRYEVPGGITDEGRVFISTETDGLIWRMRIFHDRASAEACLRENNHNLGL